MERALHDAVSNAANLGALKVKSSNTGRLKPTGNYPARDRILLEAKYRHR